MQNTEQNIDRQVDLNLNLAEGFGFNRDRIEDKVFSYATSVNIASGAHTGDPNQIDRALKRCKEYPNLAIGALIAYPDLVGYGMRRIELDSDQLRASVIAQLGSVAALAKSNAYELEHVRVHGHLYNQLATNYSVAETVAKAVQEFSKWLILVGPSGQVLEEVASWNNIRISSEARVDLRYKADGSQEAYDPEKDGDLSIETISERARNLIYKGVAKTDSGSEVKVKFETLHLWSEGNQASEAAQLIRGMLNNPMPLKSVDYEPYLSEFI